MSEESTDKDLRLIQVLLSEKLISAAQAELAKSDGEISGMTVVEVLLARRWVTEQTLDRVAPWLKDELTPPTAVTGAGSASGAGSMPGSGSVTGGDRNNNGGDADYQQNLKRYRQLMHKILDE